MAKQDTMQLVAVGALAYGWYQGSQGKLPTKLQQWYDKNIGRGSSGSGSGGSGGTGGGSGCTWDSTTMGIPACIGPLWCQTHSAPPQSVADLVAWGNANGHRNATTGAWSC